MCICLSQSEVWISLLTFNIHTHPTLKWINCITSVIHRSVFTHWGRVTHICVSKLTITVSDNVLSSGRRQTILKLKCRLRNGGHFVSASMYRVEYISCNISDRWLKMMLQHPKFVRFCKDRWRLHVVEKHRLNACFFGACNAPCPVLLLPNWATLQGRHNKRDRVSNHQPHDCLLNRFVTRRSKKTINAPRHCFFAGNSPVTGEFPAQGASNAENVSIWWRHHGLLNFKKKQRVRRRVDFSNILMVHVDFDFVTRIFFIIWKYRKDFISYHLYPVVFMIPKYWLMSSASLRYRNVLVTESGSVMMTSSKGNIFRVTGHLCGEFTGSRWIPRTKASDAELWCFLWAASE